MEDPSRTDCRLHLLLFSEEKLQRGHPGHGILPGPVQGPAGHVPDAERHCVRPVPHGQRRAGRPLFQAAADDPRAGAFLCHQPRHLLLAPSQWCAEPSGHGRKGHPRPGLPDRLALGTQRLCPWHGLSAHRSHDGPLVPSVGIGDQAKHLERFPFDRGGPCHRPLRRPALPLRLQRLEPLLHRSGCHRARRGGGDVHPPERRPLRIRPSTRFATG